MLPNRALLLTFSLTLALLLTACDIPMGGDEYDPPAAEIVDVHVEPNPVAVGDTATFTCVVERNVAGLDFAWNPPGVGNIVHTTTNQYRWVAPSEPGPYFNQVEVSRPGEPFEDVQRGFTVTVIAKD
ncbi:MAG: hypothetical protein ACR2GR_07465 [Rhodothermales bacterium]